MIVSFGDNEVGFAPMLEQIAALKTARALTSNVRERLEQLRPKLEVVAENILKIFV